MLGALCVVRSETEPFDPDETRVLTLLANSAAVAIANARLAEAGCRQAEQAAALAERERLAGDLHDHLAQTLSLLNLKTEQVREKILASQPAEALSELERIQSAIGVVSGNVRAALVGLREPLPNADDLSQRLAACVDEFRKSTGLQAELVIAESLALMLSPIVQTQVMHIVREALANVRRHAQAQHIWVRAEQRGSQACFFVKDDGCGFDPANVEGEHHLGIRIMLARAERSRGHLAIDSAPGAGTRVTFDLPLNMPHPTEQTEKLAP
jgi:two-component system nitrate/nitrite sensor histidine kinase NarX